MENERDERVMILGATNRPFDIDDGILRRFQSKIYVGHPDVNTRIELLKQAIKSHKSDISSDDFIEIGNLTEDYSGADLNSVAKFAAMVPIRELDVNEIKKANGASLRTLNKQDFILACNEKKKSSCKDQALLIEWKKNFADN